MHPLEPIAERVHVATELQPATRTVATSSPAGREVMENERGMPCFTKRLVAHPVGEFARVGS
jgi:hypothetical protein